MIQSSPSENTDLDHYHPVVTLMECTVIHPSSMRSCSHTCVGSYTEEEEEAPQLGVPWSPAQEGGLKLHVYHQATHLWTGW